MKIRWYDAVLLALTAAVGAFAAAWVDGATGFWLWLLGVTTAYVVHTGYGWLKESRT